jgi:cytochrome c-type biogenesis protein
MGATFADIANDGPLLLAVGVAALAGLVSFLSPCVLPLMPGYLSYVTGLAGADLDAALGVPPTVPPAGPGATRAGNDAPGPGSINDRPGSSGVAADRVVPAGGGGGLAVAAVPAGGRGLTGRWRVLLGTALFVAGFTVVYVLLAIAVSRLGVLLGTHRRTVDIVVGLLVVVFGLVFLGLIPGMQRELRIHRLPRAGLLGAPVLGAVFALSWAPCVGPTLGAVLGLATQSGRSDRAVVLAVAYCLGLGVPFVAFGLAYRRLLGVFRVVRRNSRWVTRFGGALLIAMGTVMVAGGWNDVTIWLLTTFNLQLDPGTLL